MKFAKFAEFNYPDALKMSGPIKAQYALLALTGYLLNLEESLAMEKPVWAVLPKDLDFVRHTFERARKVYIFFTTYQGESKKPYLFGIAWMWCPVTGPAHQWKLYGDWNYTPTFRIRWVVANCDPIETSRFAVRQTGIYPHELEGKVMRYLSANYEENEVFKQMKQLLLPPPPTESQFRKPKVPYMPTEEKRPPLKRRNSASSKEPPPKHQTLLHYYNKTSKE